MLIKRLYPYYFAFSDKTCIYDFYSENGKSYKISFARVFASIHPIFLVKIVDFSKDFYYTIIENKIVWGGSKLPKDLKKCSNKLLKLISFM